MTYTAPYDLPFGMRILSSNLAQLSSVFFSWSQTIERYRFLSDEDDPPYYYNERANISILAAASWMSGHIALEEYSCTRGENASGRARTDLYLQIGDSGFQLEMKMKWSRFGSQIGRSSNQAINQSLDTALSQAQGLEPNDGTRLGGCFVVFSHSNRPDNDNISDHIRHILNIPDISAAAWCFPNAYRATEWDGRFYPGLMILLKELDDH